MTIFIDVLPVERVRAAGRPAMARF